MRCSARTAPARAPSSRSCRARCATTAARSSSTARTFAPPIPTTRSARGIAAVFQELSLIPDLTVEQNIWFRHEPLTPLRTVDRAAMRRKTLELLDRYAFPQLRPDQELRRLTLAERQIVEIAKGLAKNPRILILDEATSALPAREAEWLLKLTRQLAAEGRLVIFISHRMAEVRRDRRPPHHLPQRPHRRGA